SSVLESSVLESSVLESSVQQDGIAPTPDGFDCGACDADAICKNTAICPVNQCDVSVKDTCTGADIPCTCGEGFYCESTTKTCASYLDCEALGKGGTNTACNDNLFYDSGDGTLIRCRCTSPGICIDDSPSQEGRCCTNQNALCQPMMCGYSATNTCTGLVTLCNCPNGYHCNASTKACEADAVCAELPGYTGAAGSVCSNGPNSSWPVGDGSFLVCPCGSATYCAYPEGAPAAGELVPSDGTEGVCIATNTCATYHANGLTGDPCSRASSSSFPRGDGVNLRCDCRGDRSCVDAESIRVESDGSVGLCLDLNTCATYQAEGNLGEVCSNGPSFPRGDGRLLECDCNSGMACADTSNSIVSGATRGVCKAVKICADYTTRLLGQPCSDLKTFDTGFGVMFSCRCDASGGFTSVVCLGDSLSDAGTCQCTPRACTCDINGESDGCGGILSCPC
ncbi:MAG: hypothetical protein JRH20_28110, partial [Deltaproteobacteria bacterium]|nr:hypothetical protein [Deltaproteobacteria bacterium]